MDIRKPKAAHSLREFAIEIGTIIIGILIALGFEAAIEAIHHRELVEHAKTELRLELLDNRQELVEANASEARAVRMMKAVLDQLRDGASNGPLTDNKAALSVKTSVMASSAWDSTIATQALSYMPFDQAHALAKAYSVAKIYNDLQSDVRKPLVDLSASGIEDAKRLDPRQLQDAEHTLELSRSYLSTSVMTGRDLVTVYDQALRAISSGSWR